jgi:phosphoglycolate phosphatase
MKVTYVVWDWNGTLLDDVGAALLSVNDILSRRQRKPIALDQYYTYLDTPIRRFYEHLFDLDREDYEQILREFNEGYCRHIRRFGLMEGAEELLEKLSESGAEQLIISSSQEEQLRRHVEAFGVSRYFRAVLGAEDYYSAGKVARAKDYFESQHIEGSSAVVIGDSLHDFQMARALRASCLLLARGHQSRKDLESAGVPVLDHMADIWPYMKG